MRYRLEYYINKILIFKAKIVRVSITTDKYFPEKTYLLKDIICLDNNEIYFDHTWVKDGVCLQNLNINGAERDICIYIEFKSKIVQYNKKHKLLNKKYFYDYGLTTPKEIKILNSNN